MLNIGTIFKDHRGFIPALSIAAAILISGCENIVGDVVDKLKQPPAKSVPEGKGTSDTQDTPVVRGKKLRESPLGPVYSDSDTKEPVIVIKDNVETIESAGTPTAKIDGSIEFRSALPGIKIKRIVFSTHGQLRSIGPGAFFKHRIRAPKIPEGVTNIGRYAFAYNDMEILQLPESLKKIGSHAFAHNKLTTVIIPRSVTDIGAYAFQGNTNLDITVSLQSLAKTPENAFPGTAVLKDYNEKRIRFESGRWVIAG